MFATRGQSWGSFVWIMNFIMLGHKLYICYLNQFFYNKFAPSHVVFVSIVAGFNIINKFWLRFKLYFPAKSQIAHAIMVLITSVGQANTWRRLRGWAQCLQIPCNSSLSMIRCEIEDVTQNFRRFTATNTIGCAAKNRTETCDQPRRICLENFNYYLINSVIRWWLKYKTNLTFRVMNALTSRIG